MNTSQSPQHLLDRLDAHDREPDVDAAWQRFEQRHFAPRRRALRWHQMAAAVAGIIFAVGLVVAAVQWSRHTDDVPQKDDSTSVAVQVVTQSQEGIVNFDNTRLDSLLAVVADHYDKTVCFEDDKAGDLRFYLTWNPDEALEPLLRRLDQFDGLTLSLRHDTIFVRREEVKP
ncbi:MAG: DUF4974 domain-containing protein [Bacteroidales bacterium]|nr:DUF4974 domain-containing protein [Bacteroidales bacterium]